MNQSFVWYRTFYDTFKELEQTDKELALKYAEAVMEYGLNGEYDESNGLINALMASAIFNIDKAQERYIKNKDDGSKGGRKEKYPAEKIWELQDQGLSKEEIIRELGCSAKTYDRKAKRV